MSRVLKDSIRFVFAVGAVGGSALSAMAQSVIVPGLAEGITLVTTPLRVEARTYQVIFSAPSIPIGSFITSLNFRLDSTATPAKPENLISYSNYDIYIGPSAVAPLAANANFLSNYAGGARTKVRQGKLEVVPNNFTAGGSPNAFGAVPISFNMGGYLYNGGDLVIEISNSGQNGGLDGLTFHVAPLDAVVNSASIAAYFANGYNAAASSGTTNAAVMQLTYQSTPVAPEPASLALLGLGVIGLLTRRRKA